MARCREGFVVKNEAAKVTWESHLSIIIIITPSSSQVVRDELLVNVSLATFLQGRETNTKILQFTFHILAWDRHRLCQYHSE